MDGVGWRAIREYTHLSQPTMLDEPLSACTGFKSHKPLASSLVMLGVGV